MNVNSEIAQLFNHHGVGTTEQDGKIILDLPGTPIVDSNIYHTQPRPDITNSQLDVRIKLSDEQELVESFGDFGESAAAAQAGNLQNFTENSFYPIMACQQQNQHDSRTTFERWTINEIEWEAYIGDFGRKSSKGVVVDPPAALFETIESEIKQLQLNQEFHWFRFFVGQYNSEINTMEFLSNNELVPLPDAFLQLPWPGVIGFYSFRLFLILRKVG